MTTAARGMLRVTVCELDDEPHAFADDWARLRAYTREQRSDLVLLPEMPFARWFALGREFDAAIWHAAMAAHDSWQARLSEFAPATVLVTRPVEDDGRRYNEAQLVAGVAAPMRVHRKRYLPDEPGFQEASWYERGDGAFRTVTCHGAQIGFQVCTELWFFDIARGYGLQGVDIVAVPRATPAGSRERWLVAGRTAAMVAGAYYLSSNRTGCDTAGAAFAGNGWIVDPDGEVLALTTVETPFATVTIDLEVATRAKKTYPCYVR